jgi:hypothetical protein
MSTSLFLHNPFNDITFKTIKCYPPSHENGHLHLGTLSIQNYLSQSKSIWEKSLYFSHSNQKKKETKEL